MSYTHAGLEDGKRVQLRASLHPPCSPSRPAPALITPLAPPFAPAPGANLIGMILWPKAKRSVAPAVARAIGEAARRHGAEPVAVFVDEDAATIDRRAGPTVKPAVGMRSWNRPPRAPEPGVEARTSFAHKT